MKPSADTWDTELSLWIEPFLRRLPRQGQRRWAMTYLKGLLLPGERKSVGPMAERVAPGEAQQLHHFIAASPWAVEPLLEVLADEAGRLARDRGMTLVVDEIVLVKQGSHSVGVARQACGEPERRQNCQILVSLTLCDDELAVPVALSLYLPESWCADPEQRRQAGIPSHVQHRPKWRIALDEIDRLGAAGLRFDRVTASAAFGGCAAFRQGLAERRLAYTLGVPPTSELAAFAEPPPMRRNGLISAHQMVGAWLVGEVEAGRVAGEASRLDGETLTWVGCTEGDGGGRSYYLTSAPELAAAALKAQRTAHHAERELRTRLGLDHFEGRSWSGLRHHVTMVMIAFCFLQHLRSISDELRPARDRRGQHSWAVPREGPVGGRAHPHHGGLALGAADAAP